MASLIGEEEIREYVFLELMRNLKSEQKVRVIRPDHAMGEIVGNVAQIYGVTAETLLSVTKDPQKENEPRKVAMYLCQELGGVKLVNIASYFGLSNIGSVSFTSHQIRKRQQGDKVFSRKLEDIIKK